MSRTTILMALVLVPFAVLGSGTVRLVDRVPTLPASIDEASSGLLQREAEAAVLQRDIDSAKSALQTRQEAVAAANQQTAKKQKWNLKKLTGMSSKEMDEADDDEMMDRMLGGMGISMAEMDALEEMDDAEAEAYLAGKQLNTQGLQEFSANAPKSSDPARLERLAREHGEWMSGYFSRASHASEQFGALERRWAQEHSELDRRLDVEMKSRVDGVRIVSCGSEGSYPDAIELHKIALERAVAHAALSPDHLKQGVEFLAARREVVKADAAFAERFAAEAAGLEEMAAQSVGAQSATLDDIGLLLRHTMEINRKVVDWVDRKAQLESVRPRSECG